MSIFTKTSQNLHGFAMSSVWDFVRFFSKINEVTYNMGGYDMQKWIFFVLFLGAGVLGLGVLFQDISERQSEAASEASVGKQLKIVASNWQFDQPEYTAVQGEATKVVFTQKEGVHELHISGSGVDIKLDKNTPTQEVTFQPGTYDIECILPCGEGHAKMKSKLVVQ